MSVQEVLHAGEVAIVSFHRSMDCLYEMTTAIEGYVMPPSFDGSTILFTPGHEQTEGGRLCIRVFTMILEAVISGALAPRNAQTAASRALLMFADFAGIGVEDADQSLMISDSAAVSTVDPSEDDGLEVGDDGLEVGDDGLEVGDDGLEVGDDSLELTRVPTFENLPGERPEERTEEGLPGKQSFYGTVMELPVKQSFYDKVV